MFVTAERQNVLIYVAICSSSLQFEQQIDSALTQLTQARGRRPGSSVASPSFCDWVGTAASFSRQTDRQTDRKVWLDWWSVHVTRSSQMGLGSDGRSRLKRDESVCDTEAPLSLAE